MNRSQISITFSVATPVITSSSTSFDIRGTALELTCTSTSDSSAAGSYEWKLGSDVL